MRKIIYRGLNNHKKWIFGSLVYTENFQTRIYFETENERIDWSYVDPASVGVFTGVNDKNGTPIFEGDVIEYTNILTGATHVVCVFWNESNHCIVGLLLFLQDKTVFTIEVIGNSYTVKK